MFIPDRTVKAMLGIIIVLLMVIAAGQLFQPAKAQTSAAPAGLVEATWKTEMVSRVKLADEDRIKSIQVLDQANAVVVQYEDRIEFLRMRPVYVNPASVELKNSNSGVSITPSIK
ncbi:MAG: hypothetical protein ABFD69_14365 [Candidatus Sumerlaeia bacterium]